MSDVTNYSGEKSFFARANKFFVEGNYNSALEHYNFALSDGANFFSLYENAAWCCEKLKDYDGAEFFYSKAFELNPNAVRAVDFLSKKSLHDLKSLKNIKEFFPLIFESVLKADHSVLIKDYYESELSSKNDDFVLLRVVGNDLFPRHAIGQSRRNVEFILRYEPALENCRKVWIVNRIFNNSEFIKITELLESYNQEYYVIPFVEDEYKNVGFDYSCLPNSDFLDTPEFEKLSSGMKQRVLISMLRLKNNYVMNNNGARNFALELGKTLGKWVLPWDGNCFLNKAAWRSITKGVLEKPYLKHFVVPMARITSNESMLNDEFVAEASEEPQIIFRCDSIEKFNAEFSYGRRPKVELFWRLKIPGVWDTYKDDRFDLPRQPFSPEAEQFGITGWTARLFSGMAEQESQNNKGAANRNSARQIAIITAISHIDNELKVDFSCPKKLLRLIEQLEIVKKNDDENKFLGDKNNNFIFLANRNDGLGERLKAMLNAIIASKLLGAEHRFVWPEKVSVGQEFHAIAKADEIFCGHYISNLFLKPNEVISDDILNLSDIGEVDEIYYGKVGRVFLCHQNEKFNFIKDKNIARDGLYKEAFYDIKFNENISSVIEFANAVPVGDKLVAIHIRGGDIVYGRYRLSQRYQNKAICYPLVITLMKKVIADGFTPVLFMQDDSVYEALKRLSISDELDFVIARDYSKNFSVTEQAFFEIVLMSRCHKVIAGTSGFAEIAARIAGIKVSRVEHFLSTDEMLNGISSWLSSGSCIDNFQKAFALLNYVLVGEDVLSISEIDAFLSQAQNLDPNNGLYPAKRVLAHLKFNNFQLADDIVRSEFEKYPKVNFSKLPIVQSLFAEKGSGYAMSKYFTYIPDFDYSKFRDVGVLCAYVKINCVKSIADGKHIDFLRSNSRCDDIVSEYASFILNGMRS